MGQWELGVQVMSGKGGPEAAAGVNRNAGLQGSLHRTRTSQTSSQHLSVGRRVASGPVGAWGAGDEREGGT